VFLVRSPVTYHSAGFRRGTATFKFYDRRDNLALAIARDIRAAPEEARALEGLGQAHLHDGSPGQAAGPLREALTIYQRIGAPAARRVQEIIQNHKLTSTNLEPSQRLPITSVSKRGRLPNPPESR
jgi:hypothetical protein